MSDRRLIARWMSRRGVQRLLLAAGLSLAGPGAAVAGEVFLSLGLARELASDLQPQVREFADHVWSASRGTMRVEVVAVEPGRDLLQMARYGKLDMVIVPNAEMAAISPEFGVLELPFLFAGREHAARVLDGEVGRELLARLERVRLRGLAFWDLGEVHFSSRDVPIRNAEDLRSLRIGISPRSEYLARVLEALGALPAQVPAAERFGALQTGAINAAEVRLEQFLSRRYYEVQGTLALTRHRYLAAPVAINWSRFEALDPGHRKVLEAAARELGERLRVRHAREEERAAVEIRERGVEVVSDPDMRLAHDIAWKLVYWEYAKRSAFDILDAIERHR